MRAARRWEGPARRVRPRGRPRAMVAASPPVPSLRRGCLPFTGSKHSARLPPLHRFRDGDAFRFAFRLSPFRCRLHPATSVGWAAKGARDAPQAGDDGVVERASRRHAVLTHPGVAQQLRNRGALLGVLRLGKEGVRGAAAGRSTGGGKGRRGRRSTRAPETPTPTPGARVKAARRAPANGARPPRSPAAPSQPTPSLPLRDLRPFPFPPLPPGGRTLTSMQRTQSFASSLMEGQGSLVKSTTPLATLSKISCSTLPQNGGMPERRM